MDSLVSESRVDSGDFLRRLDESILALFPAHPFKDGIDRENFAELMGQYAAMSVAFPYIQSGAIYQTYRRSLGRPAQMENVQTSAAVGAFLAWDEFGGHELVLTRGSEGLLQLIDTDDNFHSALLVDDVRQLIGMAFAEALPDERTAAYLDRLYDGLSDPHGNRNIAHMIAFERHAFAMITALFGSIRRLFGADVAERLDYFRAHIGSDSSGEAIHVAMTGRMIEKLIRHDEGTSFLQECLDAYALSHDWCTGLVNTPVPVQA